MIHRARLVLVADVPSLGAERVFEVLARVLPMARAGEIAVIDRDRAADRGGSPDRTRLSRLERLRALTRRHGAALIVSARADLAVAVGADGVQLPERGVTVSAIHEAFPTLPVGRSCHDRAGLEAAARAGARWALLGPVWAPISKASDGPPMGPEGLRETIAGLRLPVFGVGGVGPDNAARLCACGATGVATIGAVFGATTPEAAVRALLAATRTPPERAAEVG